jgi:hypothetical protein
MAAPVLAPLLQIGPQMFGHLGLKNLIPRLVHEQVLAPIAEQDLFKFLVA